MKLFKWFRKKTIIEVTAIYVKQGKISKELQRKIEEKARLKDLLGDKYKEDDDDEEIKAPVEEDSGIMQFSLDDLYMVSEAENPNYSVLMLTSGIQVLCNYSTAKFKAYLKTKGYRIDELH